MSDLTITNINSVNIRVDCEKSTAKELSDFFTFKVPGHEYMPTFRNKMWDGKIKLYNIYKQTIYKGLYDYVVKFAKDRNYKIIEPEPIRKSKNVKEEHIQKFIDEYLKPMAGGEEITAHRHQIEAVTHAINNDRCLLLSPTGSGKSLIIYALVRYYLDIIPKDKKILIIVPTTSLVRQMLSDFSEYSSQTKWKAEDNCHYVFAGRDKISENRVIISTWQSIYKLGRKYFDNFEVCFGDECHLFKSKSLTTLMSKLENCPYRIGTTGTLDDSLTHKLVIEGLFGRVHHVTTTKKLMSNDLLSKLKIDCILLQYPEKIREDVKRIKYQDEIDWIVTNEDRNKFICDLGLQLKGNSLILFQFVGKHGKPLFERLRREAEDSRDIFFVFGGTDVELREEIRQITEKKDNAIIVASYGTFSTGISIRRLHNIIFASPSKSRIRILQSIGRQLRKSEHKDVAKLYDIADDLHWKSYKNHTLRHYERRLKIYQTEGFDYKQISLHIKGKENG
mgnify:FL=1